MKLFRPLVALSLFVSTLNGAARAAPSPHHRHRLAALLGVRKAVVSLDETTDKLQGVLDKGIESITKVQGSYSKVNDVCVAEFKAAAQRVEANDKSMADLETTRQLNLERTAGLEASLANLVTQETEAHQSYESAVSQRAGGLQKHLSTQKSTKAQAETIGKVLEFMKKKRAGITASQTDTDNMKVVPPASPTSSGSGLDFVIGVLGNIKDTSDAKAEEGADKHNEDDAQLEKLVTSYKLTLQHIDKQYQSQNARRMEAKVTARDVGEEKLLRKEFNVEEGKVDKELFSLCGGDGKGGSVPKAMGAADFLLSQFKQQSQNAINIMDGLPDLQDGAASFLAVDRVTSSRPAEVEIVNTATAQQSQAPSASQTEAPEAESAQESAARWVIAQAAKFKDNTTQSMARAIAAKFPKGVPSRKVHKVRPVVPGRQLHTLLGANRSYQVAGAEVAVAADPADKEAEAIIKCVEDKQALTEDIIKARRAARVARTDRMSAEARVTAVKDMRELIKTQQVTFSDANDKVVAEFKPMRSIIEAKSVTQDFSDLLAEMKTIEKEVDNYIKAGGPPASAGLPKALKGVQDTLTKVKDRLKEDMSAIDSVYTGALMIKYPALINQLKKRDASLNTEGEAVADAAKLSDGEAKKQEATIKKLMIERSGREYECLQQGTCMNLRYQQCCSGSGTHAKKVTSWKECAQHCEGLVKKGKQIAGCSMEKLYKEDDQTGSGTCYAQTKCDLKPSDLKCAGSLCKPLPAKEGL